MADAYSTRRAQQRRMLDADQAEFAAIMHGSAIADAGVYDQRVAGTMDDFEPTGVSVGTTWQRQDLESDTAVGSVQEELLRRSTTMATAYPFVLTGNKLSYSASETRFYEFCLAISLAPNLSEGKYAELPRVFERVATVLVSEYLGAHSKAVHTGKPRDKSVGTKFKAAMDHLHKLSGEWFWSPWDDLPGDPDTTGDEGFDFVVWKETLDKREGSLFLLGQCACGDDWDTKFGDIDLGRIQKWFHPLSYAPPVRAFATPRHICNLWVRHVVVSAGLLFDRARLALIPEIGSPRDELEHWKDSMKELSEFVFSVASGTTTSGVVA